MKRLIQILAALLVILTGAQLYAQEAKYLCTKLNGAKVRATACEPLAKPTTPPTLPTPVPGAACSSDRTLRYGVPGVNPTDLALVGKVFPYDQKVELCATLPAPAKVAALLSSTNHSNAQCNVYDVWLISPSGKYYQSRSVQPGTSAPYEAGLWKITVYLDSTDAACAKNHALDLLLSSF